MVSMEQVDRDTWGETVVASEAGRAFAFAVVLVAGRIVLTFECWKEAVETVPIRQILRIPTMEDSPQVCHHIIGRVKYSSSEIEVISQCNSARQRSVYWPLISQRQPVTVSSSSF